MRHPDVCLDIVSKIAWLGDLVTVEVIGCSGMKCVESTAKIIFFIWF